MSAPVTLSRGKHFLSSASHSSSLPGAGPASAAQTYRCVIERSIRSKNCGPIIKYYNYLSGGIRVKKNAVSLFVLLSFLFYLFFFPQNALSSAREGLLLWYHSVIPVLFPFLLLCNVAIRLHLTDALSAWLFRPLHLLFGCSRSGAFAIFTGFLMGFPMGAKVTSELAQNGMISREEEQFLYGFVNNASPAFLLSYLAADQLGNASIGPVFLVNILGSSALYGILRSISFRRKAAVQSVPESCAAESHAKASFSSSMLDECISDAAFSALRIGAYLILFSILTGAVLRLLPASRTDVLILASSLELTTGIRLLCQASLPWPVNYLALSAVCTFGGFSALAQTISIARLDRTQRKYYIKSRVACTLLSIAVACGTLAACAAPV